MNRRAVKLADNTISAEDMASLADWLKEGHQVTHGPLTRQFETAFAAYVGTKYSIMVNSGSSANLLITYGLLEAGYLRNKKVIVPAVSWTTTLSPFVQLAFECFLCDADANDLGVDLNHLEHLLKDEQPSLLILVHILGHMNQMDAIRRLCARHDCLVIEDACEALGSEYKGVKAGALSLAGSFSFYYGHHISTIEGGAITTSDDKLYSVMLSIRSHGWSRDVPDTDRQAWKKEFQIDDFRELYSFYFAGFNMRPTELNAYLGLIQLKRLPEIAKIRAHNFEFYRQALPEFWSQSSEGGFVSSFSFGTYAKNRLETSKNLLAQGVECRPLVCGSMGRQPFWIKKHGVTHLPVADKVHDFGLYLPNHANISAEDITYVAKHFREVAHPI